MYRSTKSYGHELGLSCCFRQWRAKSHCRLLHGYSLAFNFVFGCDTLDENGWVVDFGSLKDLKALLAETFDHKLAVAGDDPELAFFKQMDERKLADVLVFPDGVGCEAFARWAFAQAEAVVRQWNDPARGVYVVSAECREHAANSAIYMPDQRTVVHTDIKIYGSKFSGTDSMPL